MADICDYEFDYEIVMLKRKLINNYEKCAYNFRSGYDGNHMSRVILNQSHAGHFGAENSFVTDESGSLIPECMFGTNHIAVLSNDARYGNLDHGVTVDSLPEEGATRLPVNVNGSWSGEHGAGSTLVLCSGWESEISDARFVSAVYVIRSGWKENKLQSSLLSGDDSWTFAAEGDGTLTVTGSGRYRYAVYHNRDNLVQDVGVTSRSFSTQSLMGSAGIELVISGDKHCAMLVLCSHSSGVEDATVASLYLVSCSIGNVKSVLINHVKGSDYKTDAKDLWSFEVTNQRLRIRGPDGPCRVAFLSNLRTNDVSNFDQRGCLATGEDEPIRGAVAIDNNELRGWVSRPSAMLVTVNELKRFWFREQELKAVGKKWAFRHKWNDGEKTPGVSLVRIFAVRNHISGKSRVIGNHRESFNGGYDFYVNLFLQ